MSLQSEMEAALGSSGRYEPSASARASSALKRASNDTHCEQIIQLSVTHTGKALRTFWAVPILAVACMSGYFIGRVPPGGMANGGHCVAGGLQSAGRDGEVRTQYAGQGSHMLSPTLTPLW
jgi:hypothetical protein